DQIMRIARQNKIPIHEDRGLVEALAQLDVGAVIPRELYIVVAEVLAWVYQLDATVADAKNVTPS
ncbi:MAG: EscU/YscU/HrcU family type III secretion system export apparatus switch protein, partial [Candidatus Eremiobacteraeota bacterium]|nr:EscU/YscU/HrcU family type III secretion system export apparatus switch protein [Candidatus Eremiobacteraeota bacterium]